MRRFVFLFMGIGAALPVIWFAVYHLYPAFDDWWFKTPTWTSGLVLALWPSWLLMLGDPEDKSLILPIISTGVNAVLYGILGALIWIGWKRSKAVLAVAAAALFFVWYGLLTLLNV